MSTAWQAARTSEPVLSFEVDSVTVSSQLERFVIWIDAVGGFLVCPTTVVTFGQAIPGARIDVPLVADVSRQQFAIRRDPEGYVIQPVRDTTLAGRRLEGAMALRDVETIGLGPVELKFVRPHALSATARIEFVSPHRTQPSCNAVLLMGESCVLGPKANSHVVCRDWTREVVLFRQADTLLCLANGSFEIDGRACQNRGPLRLGSHVAGPDFSFSLEALP